MNRKTRLVLLMVIALLLMLAPALTTQAQQGNPPPPDQNGGQQQGGGGQGGQGGGQQQGGGGGQGGQGGGQQQGGGGQGGQKPPRNADCATVQTADGQTVTATPSADGQPCGQQQGGGQGGQGGGQGGQKPPRNADCPTVQTADGQTVTATPSADGQPCGQQQGGGQGGQGGQNGGGQGGQGGGGQNGGAGFNISQALSPEAQRNTIAFSALAFLTGDFNADTFFPPGKVADMWGFQYLRDNDPSGMGHNTDFLTYASLNMLNVLTADQRAALQVLAESQVDAINQYAVMRFTLIDAFRRNLEGDIPTGTTGLNMQAVQDYSAQLYQLDGAITLERAKVMSSILNALTSDQKAYLDSMVGVGMTSWNQPQEPEDLRGLGHDVKVNVMTYAGDLFSWYAGSVEADTYINPERQGTYFGAFYMKDAPAVGNPGYTISSSLTSDMGQAFLQTLTPEQSALIEDIVNSELPYLQDIVTTRSAVSTELRRSLEGGTINDETVLSLMDAYGQQDGAVVYFFAKNFALINASLTDEQRAQLMSFRQQMLGGLTANQPFIYSQPVSMPSISNTDFLFS